MTLNIKILSPVAILACLLLGLLGYNLYEAKRLDAALVESQKVTERIGLLSLKLNEATARVATNLLAYHIKPNNHTLAAFKRVRLLLERLMSEFEIEIATPQSRRILMEYRAAQERFFQFVDSVIAAVDSGDTRRTELAFQKWKLQADRLQAVKQDLLMYNNKHYGEMMLSIREAQGHYARDIGTIILAIVVIIFIMIWYLRRTVTRPILQLTKAANLIIEGKLQAVSTGQGDDEIGVLANAFYKMTRQLIDANVKLANKNIETERQLFTEKELAHATLMSIADAVIITDAVGCVRTLNPIAETLLGCSSDEAKGTPLDNICKLIDEQNRNPAHSLVPQCVMTGESISPAVYYVIIRNDGIETPVKMSIAPIHGRDDVIGTTLVFHDMTETRRMSRKMTYLASHDTLTGLVNRKEFERRVSQLLDTIENDQSEHALCYMDLDQFRIINDTCGHVAGDELLQQLGGLLKENVRKQDTLSRLGGDEFAVLMEHCAIEQAQRLANDLHKAFSKFQFVWERRNFNIGVSIGLVSITAESKSLTEILKQADTACLAAKDSGRNRIQIFHKDDVELNRRHGEMQWVSRINSALEEDRFCLYIQPIISVNKKKVVYQHFEVLVRMLDESGDIIPPGLFLPVAERYNLSPRIDRWVVANVFNWFTSHPQYQKQLSTFFINLSGLSLTDEEFLDFIVNEFTRTRMPPNKICFEVTETAAIASLTHAVYFINKLRSLGCRFALDDFGSGLSSFAYLKTLPVDYLKLDGMFVKDMLVDPIDHAMVRSINEIGQVMGMQTIAEFVESQAILKRLLKIGVNYAQGYGIEMPRPIHEMMSIAMAS